MLVLMMALPAMSRGEDPVVHANASSKSNIEYAHVGDLSLKLDLYLPAVKDAPLIVWVHGGAWRSGSRSPMPLAEFVAAGYAVASIDYRLSTQARFPANIHDIKAALRFLRAKQNVYGFNATNIAVFGESAGGHLVALVGTTNGDARLEGVVGQHLDQSSDVQAIVSYFGASNLTSILQQSTPHGLSVRIPALELLLGGLPEDKPEIARLASPVFHVDSSDPPLLLIHGDQDFQMPINQSHELNGRYEAAGGKVQFQVVHGAAHGGGVFYDRERRGSVLMFLDGILKK